MNEQPAPDGLLYVITETILTVAVLAWLANTVMGADVLALWATICGAHVP